jgi:hypothetical protein
VVRIPDTACNPTPLLERDDRPGAVPSWRRPSVIKCDIDRITAFKSARRGDKDEVH